MMLPDFRIRQRDSLLEIARALTQELDLDKLLGRILKIAVEMLAGQAGLIALRSESGGWRSAATHGLPQPLLKLIESFLADVPNHDDPERFDLAEINRAFNELTYTASLGLLNGVGLPLIARQKVVGLLFIFRGYSGVLSTNDHALLSNFANQAAIAVQNAQLYSQVNQEKERLLETLGQQGAALSASRRQAAIGLQQSIENELNDLHMSGARFQVDFQQTDDPQGACLPDGRRVAYHAQGLERVEFLIAPNPGEGFKPLVKIASGGETSRLMLALKNTLAQADHVPTLIFDEIDQGIGGRVGAIVGQKLWQLGRRHQVLCITHLPQLAAYGEQHVHVEKQIQAGRTVSHVRQLEGHERLVELAQMLGGVSEGSLQTAQELLDTVQQLAEAGPPPPPPVRRRQTAARA